MRAVRQSQVW